MATNRELNRRLKFAEKEIKNLKEQLSQNFITSKVPDYSINWYYEHSLIYSGTNFPILNTPDKEVYKLTTEGKINAILKYLGIELNVEQKKVIPATTKVTKVKKTTKGKK